MCRKLWCHLVNIKNRPYFFLSTTKDRSKKKQKGLFGFQKSVTNLSGGVMGLAPSLHHEGVIHWHAHDLVHSLGLDVIRRGHKSCRSSEAFLKSCPLDFIFFLQFFSFCWIRIRMQIKPDPDQKHFFNYCSATTFIFILVRIQINAFLNADPDFNLFRMSIE